MAKFLILWTLKNFLNAFQAFIEIRGSISMGYIAFRAG